MSEVFWTTFFATLPATIAAIGAVVVAVIVAIRQTKTQAAVEEVHKATNSMKDALIVATEKEAFARGVKSESDKLTDENPKRSL